MDLLFSYNAQLHFTTRGPNINPLSKKISKFFLENKKEPDTPFRYDWLSGEKNNTNLIAAFHYSFFEKRTIF